MKFLYRMKSAPAGRYYTEQGVRNHVPVLKLDRRKEKKLYGGLLWYDKNNDAWALIEKDGKPADFPNIDEAYKVLTENLNAEEVPFCITVG